MTENINQDKVLAARQYIQNTYPNFPIPEKSYLILMIPRTGSNLLATHLQNINYGYPIEAFHFNHERIKKVYDWDIDFSDPAAYMKQVIDFQTVEGVFGMKLNWYQRDTFLQIARQLTAPYDKDLTDKELFEIFFPQAAYIFMKRLGKVKQAVSFSKGMQTGIWMVRTDQDEAYKDYILSPVYDREHIEGCLEELLAYDVAWENYLQRNNINYLEIWYEELASNFSTKMSEIYKYLGIDRDTIPQPSLRKQANAKSSNWAERFAEETPWLRDKIIEDALKKGDFETALIHRSVVLIHQKEQKRWHSMPANRFKGIRKFILRVRRKIKSFFN